MWFVLGVLFIISSYLNDVVYFYLRSGFKYCFVGKNLIDGWDILIIFFVIIDGKVWL